MTDLFHQLLAPFLEWDHAASLAINRWQDGGLRDRVVMHATEVGNGLLVTVLLVVALLARRKASWKQLSWLVLGSVVVGACGQVLKFLIARPRPYSFDREFHIVGPELIAYSFPSGHTFASFAVLAALYRFDRTLFWLWLPVAFFVGWSRVYLGVHFVSDVIAGMVYGVASMTVFMRLTLGRTRPAS